MDYYERFLKRSGQTATVTSRNPVATSKAITNPSSKTGWRISERDTYWDGLILADSSLVPGEVVTVGGKTILVMAAETDPVSQQIKFMGAKKNIDLTWKQKTPSVDLGNNISQVWANVSTDIPCFGQIVNAYLVQEDPGLLPTTKYLFYIPDTYAVQKMDRVVSNTGSCQVDALDGIVLDGIVRLQCSDDLRT